MMPLHPAPLLTTPRMMTLAMVHGLGIMPRCGALISVMWACARWAMNSCSAGVTMWSFRPTMSQDGIVAQAGVPDGSVNALVASGPLGGGQDSAFAGGLPLASSRGKHSYDLGVSAANSNCSNPAPAACSAALQDR
jgi:hypothetical protein